MSAPDPVVSIHEAFDRVHDGTAQIIDSTKCALALYVLTDGQIRMTSPYDAECVASMLRQLLAMVVNGDLAKDAE